MYRRLSSLRLTWLSDALDSKKPLVKVLRRLDSLRYMRRDLHNFRVFHGKQVSLLLIFWIDLHYQAR
jgi:hypothetical protein